MAHVVALVTGGIITLVSGALAVGDVVSPYLMAHVIALADTIY